MMKSLNYKVKINQSRKDDEKSELQNEKSDKVRYEGISLGETVVDENNNFPETSVSSF